jgi:ubiquinol-cytochrome c reductase iron-sulfur subunit
MSNDGVNSSRRTFLIGLTSAIGAAGAVGVAVPFVKSWQPSAKAKNAGAPVKVDIGRLEAGQRVVEEWRGQPIWVVRRTENMLDTLPQLDEKLRDPASEMDQQPDYARNEWRSIKKEYLVLVGTFFCPCHGSKFDFAGRVYKGVPAPTNLVVPPHSYLSEAVVIVGSEEGETKA